MQGFAFFNQRTNPVCLLPFAADVEDEAFDFGAADVVDEAGFNWGAPGRQFVDDGHIQVGEKNSWRACAGWAWRTSSVGGRLVLCFEGEALGDAEAVLFVHNHQAQILELDVV